MLNQNINLKCEWFFIQEKGPILGPFNNFITTAGLSKVAEDIESLATPYLIVGNDTAAGETINEVFRKAVSSVIRSGNMIRFRTQLLPSECNGNFQKASIFFGGTGTTGTGSMFNLLKQPWSKVEGTVVTVEARVTVQDGGV